MEEHRCRHMPVVDGEGDLVGLVTHRDLLRYALIEQPEVPRFVETALLERLTVGDVMVREVETVDPGAELRQAAQTMIENKFGCLPVVEGRRLVGILTESDFVRRVAQGA
jgi:CBS domain-containing membrane protein